jgi:hypothetical protein
MGANKLETYEIMKVNRQDIHGADYNPRKISEAARKKLKAGLKKHGLVQPIVVNKNTMNVVSGHQRLSILDDILKKPDYELTIALIDVDEKDEVALNVSLNNQALMGEWDVFALQDLKEIFPDIDYEADFGFDQSDIEIMFGKEDETAQRIEEQEKAQEFTSDTFRETKKKMREKAKAENEAGGSYNLADNDYAVTVVFPNNHEKHEFMRKIRKDPKETYLKSTIFYDIAKGVYDISVLGNKD